MRSCSIQRVAKIHSGRAGNQQRQTHRRVTYNACAVGAYILSGALCRFDFFTVLSSDEVYAILVIGPVIKGNLGIKHGFEHARIPYQQFDVCLIGTVPMARSWLYFLGPRKRF